MVCTTRKLFVSSSITLILGVSATGNNNISGEHAQLSESPARVFHREHSWRLQQLKSFRRRLPGGLPEGEYGPFTKKFEVGTTACEDLYAEIKGGFSWNKRNWSFRKNNDGLHKIFCIKKSAIEKEFDLENLTGWQWKSEKELVIQLDGEKRIRMESSQPLWEAFLNSAVTRKYLTIESIESRINPKASEWIRTIQGAMENIVADDEAALNIKIPISEKMKKHGTNASLIKTALKKTGNDIQKAIIYRYANRAYRELNSQFLSSMLFDGKLYNIDESYMNYYICLFNALKKNEPLQYHHELYRGVRCEFLTLFDSGYGEQRGVSIAADCVGRYFLLGKCATSTSKSKSAAVHFSKLSTKKSKKHCLLTIQGAKGYEVKYSSVTGALSGEREVLLPAGIPVQVVSVKSTRECDEVTVKVVGRGIEP